ncbi:MAG: hypothetical protein CL916_10775 [Deltaproteobacteria bacterium]|nr:hypothetical protein [Deltaproteobacteria bacterium]
MQCLQYILGYTGCRNCDVIAVTFSDVRDFDVVHFWMREGIYKISPLCAPLFDMDTLEGSRRDKLGSIFCFLVCG